MAFGLVSVVPGVDSVHVRWRANKIVAGTAEVGLFLDLDPTQVFDGIPAFIADDAGRATIGGLSTDTRYFVGLAVRQDEGPWIPGGEVLFVRTGAPIYADPNADGVGADGLTPGTAFNDIFLAVVTAFANGGGNIWAARGEFRDVSFPLLEGVDLYGGFAAGFELEERDADDHPTVLLSFGGQYVVRADAGQAAQVIDGFAIDGLDATTNGIDVSDTELELRSLTLRRSARGVRMRNATTELVSATLVHCAFVDNSLEGVSFEGAFDVSIEDSLFQTNGTEGLDAGALVALDGGTSTVVVRDSLFVGNGADGMDFDLAAPAAGGDTGGHFEILIEDSDFAGNGFASSPPGRGLNLDVDFEAFPAWSASLVVRGCSARANASDGVHLDLDADADSLIHRLLAAANRAHGLSITSESRPGMATVSASALFGNGGAGVSGSIGNFGLVLSHCILAGNSGGGLVSDPAPASAVSSVAFLQPAPWPAGAAHASVVLDTAMPLPFLYSPTEFLTVEQAAGGAITVTAQPGFGPDTIVELDDDETVRTATAVGSLAVTVDPPPEGDAPIVLTALPGTDSVTEDWRLDDASPAVGAGMSAPGAEPVDAGVFGSPLGGDPGAEGLVPDPLFWLAESNPPWSLPIAPGSSMDLHFLGGLPTAASLATGLFVVDADGQPVPVTPFVDAGRIVVPPPIGGWNDGDWIELHGGLLSAEGVGLSTPVALRMLVP